MFENYTYLQIFVITIIVLLLGIFSYNNMNNALIQVIISLIILLLMGYIGYNIYLIELQNMFQGENDIRKEVIILNGTYDFSNHESKFNTIDKTQVNFKDIRPSTKQDGGAEYSYNFWIYINGNNNALNDNDNWYSYRYKEWKNVFYRGTPMRPDADLSGLVQYPGVWLTPVLNNMVIVFQNSTYVERFEINGIPFKILVRQYSCITPIELTVKRT
jgi:hypothetical protein